MKQKNSQILTPSQIASPVFSDDRFGNLAALLNALNANWKPNPSQQIAGEYIFRHGARRVFLECGRKFGKTEFAADLCWRLGNMIKNGQGYYFGAYQKSVREFLWKPKRLQNHGPQEYVSSIHETDMRFTFSSGTYVKLDGADEFKISKGFNPDFVILDEFADYPEDFWPAMSPNFASKDAIVIIMSSPPWLLESEPGKPVLFVRIADTWKQYMEEAKRAKKKTKYIYMNLPSHCNAMNLAPGFLENEEKELKALGLEDIWEREYLAKRVVGGGKRIIGTFNKEKHVRSHEFCLEKIEKDKSILAWTTMVDPSQSAFGVLIMAINPHTKHVWFLDEILEKSEDETTEHILQPRIKAKEDELYTSEEEDPFLRVCDEAAKWWIVGCANDPNLAVNYLPTEKATNSIEFGISLLRSLFRYNKATLSDRCKWFAWQLENWRKTKNGGYPDSNDDLIDCARYGLHVNNFFLTEEDKKEAPVLTLKEKVLRSHRSMEQELQEDLDWAAGDTLGFNDDILINSEDKWMQ